MGEQLRAMTRKCSANAECEKNYEVLLLAALTSILKLKWNAWLAGPYFGSNCLKTEKSPVGGMGGSGIDWYMYNR